MAEPKPGRKVIVAMDGSHFSAYAFDWYMRNAHRKSDHVILAHCPEYHAVYSACAPMEMADASVMVDLYHEEESRIKEFIESLGQRLKDNGIGGKVKCETGVPGHVICKIAEEEDASLIVTGSRGLSTLRRTLLGSVSDHILHHSHVPVVVCRHKDHFTHHGHKHGPHGYISEKKFH